jgi:hypothetical protein
MKLSPWKAAWLMLIVSVQAHSQGVIQVKVVDRRSTPIPSDIQFRRSSGAIWETLGRAESGQTAISFACAPGIQLRADPLNGRYTNSDALPCRDALTLQVAERSVGFAFDGVDHDDAVTRGEFANLLAREEREEDGALASHGDEHAADAAEQSDVIRRLNESSEFFDRIDRNGDERISRAEAEAAPNR